MVGNKKSANFGNQQSPGSRFQIMSFLNDVLLRFEVTAAFFYGSLLLQAIVVVRR